MALADPNKIILLCCYGDQGTNSRVSSRSVGLAKKGVCVQRSSLVSDVVTELLRRFEIVTARPTQFTLYAPAPHNCWLKRAATLDSFPFLTNKMELTLAEEPAQDAAAAAAGAGPADPSKSTDSANAPPANRSVGQVQVTGEGAPSPKLLHARSFTVDLTADKPVMLKVCYTTPDGATAIVRKLLCETSKSCKQVLDDVLARFALKLGDAVAKGPMALYAPPPFDTWLDPALPLGAYRFFETNPLVQLRPAERDLQLRINWHSGEITRTVKVSPEKTVREVIDMLLAKYPVNNPDDWGLIGKERDAPARFWLGETLTLADCAHINLKNLIFKERGPAEIEAFRKAEEAATKNRPVASGVAAARASESRDRRGSVRLQDQEPPASCLGCDPQLLPMVDDQGTSAPQCLVRLRRALVEERYGLQAERVFLRDGAPDEVDAVFDALDASADKPLPAHVSAHALANAILCWFGALPTPVFQPLHAKLERAATNYEASLLLAAQLPQSHGLLLAWLMALMCEVALQADVNGATVAELGAAVANVLVRTDSEKVQDRLPKICAIILQDKVDERLERAEMMRQYSSSLSISLGAGGGGSGSSLRPYTADNMDALETVDELTAMAISAAAHQASSSAVRGWSAQQVADWVATTEFAEYADRFLGDEVDGECLADIQQTDLNQLGVTKLGQQKKFLKLIKSLF